VDLAVFDLSFISLRLVVGPVAAQVKPGGTLLMLIKPQFEVGREQVGKGGIVRDPGLRARAVEDLTGFVDSLGFSVQGTHDSRLPGADGNREVFLLAIKPW
jgi:23S rRNA (cytidine1920-2'-O)/16S rRNA (cytidine1409-2'-O)-methyltransferase